MRYDAVKKVMWLFTPGMLLCGLIASGVRAQPPGEPPRGPRNSAVVNKERKNTGPDQRSWIWRSRKLQPPGDGFEGIAAHISKRKLPGGATNPDHATLRIWLYDAIADETTENTAKLQLSEKYAVHLTELNETNSENSGNRSFHFAVTLPINGADGLPDPERAGTRTFLITGTRELGQNGDRTLRVTTFTSLPPTKVAPVPVALSGTRPVASPPCSDYPDDAVLEEEQYSLSEPVPTEEPNPDDAWMSYSYSVP